MGTMGKDKRGRRRGQASTFVAVNQIVFDDNTSAIDCSVYLCLASHLAEILGRFLAASPCRHFLVGEAQDMASEELVGAHSFGQRHTGLGIAGVEKCGRDRNQEDVLADGDALGGERALGEGAEKWI